MEKRHRVVLSSRSLVGATDAAQHLGFSRRALGYHIASGLRPDFGGPLLRREQRPKDADYPPERSPHARFFWETAYLIDTTSWDRPAVLPGVLKRNGNTHVIREIVERHNGPIHSGVYS